jgi:chromosomal replication initiation ATPase DnaA
MEMTPLQIKNKIELDFGVKIKKQCKLREYVYPRAIYFKLCREYTELTLQQLAESVGLTNHATVLRAINHTFYDAIYENRYKNYYDRFKRQMDDSPTLEQENKLLKVKIKELEQVIDGYRFNLIG